MREMVEQYKVEFGEARDVYGKQELVRERRGLGVTGKCIRK